jgi:hypothetical protein
MRLRSCVIAILLAVPSVGRADDALGPEAPRPIYTRQNSFGVPFVMDPAEPGARKATEVQLHVSENAGPWRLYAKAAPTNGSILFRATRDGEYRFLVRTKDDHGELQPAGPPHPELTVILDTDPPVLELLVERGEGGSMHARWRVRDAHLKPDSLRLEYQIGPDGPWVPVAIDLPVAGATTSAREATWVPEARSVPITVRAEVSDYSGNFAKTQRTVAAVIPKGDPADDPADKFARWPGEKTQNTPLDPNDPPEMPGNFPSRRDDLRNLAGRRRYGDVAEQIGPGVIPPTTEILPAPPAAESIVGVPSTERVLPIPNEPEEVGLPPSANEARQSVPRTRRDLEQVDGPRLPGPAALPTSTDGSNVNLDTVNGTATPPREEPLPPGVQPRMFNTRRIELDYDVESSSSGSPPKIEIWGTRDSGHTWSKYGSHDNEHGPAFVTVDSDGLYGFRIVVASASDGAEEAPRSGDPPDIWINVDTEKPSGRILSADVDPNSPGTILVRWEANDSFLAARPISLYWSNTVAGPWAPIGLDLANTGSHAWTTSANMPGPVYLRLEVRDLAGNLLVVDTPSPMPLSPGRPRVRIRDARPISAPPAPATTPAAQAPVWRDFRR